VNDPASDPPGETVFVYGSLRRGASRESFMEGAQWLGDGTTLGTLHWVGGQAALVPGKEAGRITGDVFLVNPDHLARLDEMEGGRRRETARGMRVLIMLGLIVAACLVLLAFATQAFR
jgi:gamma-glutamylcyclotransferase (GGCT)/AIG2-like uncharacterized protein YtfP